MQTPRMGNQPGDWEDRCFFIPTAKMRPPYPASILICKSHHPMNQRRLPLRALPVGIAVLVVCFQYFSAEKFTNEAGRTAHHALNPQQEEQLGRQSYQQVLQES